MIKRKIKTPGKFFMEFLGFSLLVGIGLYIIIEATHLDTMFSDIIPKANYYLYFIINEIITIILTIGLMWLCTNITFKYNALRAMDVNKVVMYFIIVGSILIVLSLLAMFSPFGNLRYVFLAVIFKILPSVLIAMDAISNVLNFLISIYFFRRFLLDAAEDGDNDISSQERTIEG